MRMAGIQQVCRLFTRKSMAEIASSRKAPRRWCSSRRSGPPGDLSPEPAVGPPPEEPLHAARRTISPALAEDAGFPRGLRIYTKTGDGGTSATFTGERRPKDDLVFEALGTVDELSATIGLARALARTAGHQYCWQLARVQCVLQEIGSLVATPRSSARQAHTRRAGSALPPARVAELERWIDEHTGQLPPLTSFILPGGGVTGATLHLARTVCRRAERTLTPLARAAELDTSATVYLNRLSDFLFTVARVAAAADGVDEEIYSRPLVDGTTDEEE